jgi:hypothetical protein
VTVKIHHLLPAERDCFALYAVAQPPYLSVIPVVAWGRVKRRETPDEEVVGFVAYLDVRPADEIEFPLRFVCYYRQDCYPEDQLDAIYEVARELGRQMERAIGGGNEPVDAGPADAGQDSG